MGSRLNVARIRALSKPGRYADGGTLYLVVALGGTKSWVQRLTVNGRRHDIGLGPWPVVSLAEARELAFQNRRIVRRGGDPLAEKRKRRAPTFAEALAKVIDANSSRWRSPKTAKNWRESIERYAMPTIGTLPVDRIGREDVLRILTPIWTQKPAIARKLRQRLGSVFQWAQAHGYIESNPAGESISGALPRMPAVKSNFRALPYSEIASALGTIETSGASIAAKLALRLVVLTACRSGEVRLARWSEIDVVDRVWRIPPERMKTEKEHRVPLSAPALAVLEAARVLDDGSGLIFPSPVRRGKALSDMTLTKVLRDTGLAERATVHGMRSSFRDWAAETGKRREDAEAALAHAVPGVEGSYFRSDLFERRRRLMDSWAAFVTRSDAKVVRIRG